MVYNKRGSRPEPAQELAELRARLSEAEETLQAIQNGGVDALVVKAKQGPKVYTLEGAEHAYRVLIESMNEGALTLTAELVILYANQCFARMVKCPLNRIIGCSFERLLSAEDLIAVRTLLKRRTRSGARLLLALNASDGSAVPTQVSIRPLPKHASEGARFGVVVTDMTESRQSQERLHLLSQRLATAQEAERGHVAVELTDNITQSLVAMILRLQLLVNQLPAGDFAFRGEAIKLSKLVGETADEVTRISRKLRPSLLRDLGLVAALRAATEEFVIRTGVRIKLDCARVSPRTPPEARMALYRIFEEALSNIEKHACAQHVIVRLAQRGDLVHLSIKDDGVGFDPTLPPANRRQKHRIGLLLMQQRAAYVGGVLTIRSAPRRGTEIKVRIPLPQGAQLMD